MTNHLNLFLHQIKVELTLGIPHNQSNRQQHHQCRNIIPINHQCSNLHRGNWFSEVFKGDSDTARYRSVFVVSYLGFTIMWKSQLQTEISLRFTDS